MIASATDPVVEQPTDTLNKDVKKLALDHLNSIQEHIEILGAQVTKAAVVRAQEKVNQKDFTFDNLRQIHEDILSRLKDELEAVDFYYIDKRKAPYYSPDRPLFGVEVNVKFVSAALEIDEAGKCFALNRNTAAVFHLMRCIEIGIRSLARSLGIPDPTKPSERNWGAILRVMKEEMELRNKGAVKKWQDQKDFFESAYTSLDAVRNAWRNNTMHVEKVYTEDEAEHIFMNVREFMKKIAGRLDEWGMPLA